MKEKLSNQAGQPLPYKSIYAIILGLGFLIPGSGMVFAFLKPLLISMGAGFLSDGLEKLGNLTPDEFRKILKDELEKSDLHSDLKKEFSVLLDEYSSKTSEQLTTILAQHKEEIGDKLFDQFKNFMPEPMKLEFDKINDKLDFIIPILTSLKQTTYEINVKIDIVLQKLDEIEKLKRELGNRISITSYNVFVLGYCPPVKGIYGRDVLADEYAEMLSNDTVSILWLYGMGGIGKSTLAAMIFNQLHSENVESKRFNKFIWYNLSEKPGPEQVIRDLLFILTGGDIPSQPPDKPLFKHYSDSLGTCLNQEPCFVALDNIDIAMKKGGKAGELDETWYSLLELFSGSKSSLITTSRPLPWFSECECKPVEGIDREAALALMRKRGLRDSDEVLFEAISLLQRHPMALTALAAVVQHSTACNGFLGNETKIMDIIRRNPVRKRNPILLFEEIIHPVHLPTDELCILSAITILMRPEIIDAITALRPEIDKNKVPSILNELVNRSLVRCEIINDQPFYSLHSLISEVAGKYIEDSKAFHIKAYDYYLSIPWNWETKDPQEIMHLIEAVKHALYVEDISASDAILYGELNLADKLQTWGRYDIALDIHKQELEVACKVGNSEDQMHAAGRLGQCFHRIGHYPKALEFLNHALDIAREIGDKSGEGAWLGRIGQIYQSRSDYPKALEFLNQALDIAREIGDKKNEGVWLGDIGRIYQSRSDYPKALEFLNKALDIARKTGDKLGEGFGLGTIGQIYQSRSDYPKALEFLNKALDIACEIGNKINEGVWLAAIGQIYQSRSDYPKALEFLNKALDIACEIGDKYNEGVMLGTIGQIYQSRSDYGKALEFINQALDIAREIGDKYNEGIHNTSIGLILMEINRPCDAVPYFERALEITKQIGLTQYIAGDQRKLDKARRLCKKKSRK